LFSKHFLYKLTLQNKNKTKQTKQKNKNKNKKTKQTKQKQNKQNKMASSRTPFCSVCMQAGRPNSEYFTHYTMSDSGPRGEMGVLMLSLECRYCHELGHTPKYSPHPCSPYTRAYPSGSKKTETNQLV
jgi:hypothetical protein